VIGDIAILRLPELTMAEKRRMGKALTSEVKNVKCVYEQQRGIEGEYRLRTLRHIAGEKRTLTLHRENGCAFRVDVARCYFSPRLATERLRIARQVNPREKVLNMFAGVGPFSILVAKTAGAVVTSCEINDFACDLHEENNRLNKVKQKVQVVRGDAGELPTSTKFDRVLMPHPSQSNKFLPHALALAKKGSTIYYYRYILGRNEHEASSKLLEELSDLVPEKTSIVTRRVREVGPMWVEMAAELRITA